MTGPDSAGKEKKQRNGAPDYGLCLVVLILAGFGLVVLYSTSAWNGQVKFADPAYYLKKQLLATSLGLAAMYAVSCIDFRRWKNLAVPGYLISLVLQAAVLFFGDEYNGSKRWLSIGPLSFQPSEFAKVAVIVLLARVISGRGKKIVTLWQMLGVMLPTLPLVGLVGTNNLSTAIIIMGIAVILIFVASPGYLRFVFIGAGGAGFLAVFLSLESYRLERLAIWRHPEAYEKGYQTMQGLYAIGSGGLFGVGFGGSLQKLGFVPEAQNDMIFSIVCEEFGLVGAGASDVAFCAAGLAALQHCPPCAGFVRMPGGDRHHGPHPDSGDTEHRRGDQHDSEHRHHSALRQLWRYLGFISSVGNGACVEYIPQSPPRGARHMLMV